MSYKIFCSLLWILVACGSSYAQVFVPSSDTVSRRLSEQLTLYPQEKLYVSTDKEYYMAGDTMRLRAHVIDAATGKPVSLSKYVYVQLQGGTVTTGRITATARKTVTSDAPPTVIKLLERNGIYEGYIPLPLTTSEGDYTLSAYTWFMKNQGEDYFFKKGIRVNSYGKPYLSEEAAKSSRLDYHVAFFPEGGYLISGMSCRVGFKALSPDGLGAHITGSVVDERGDTVAFLQSLHAGMGSFRFVPQPGREYYVKCVDKYGAGKRFRLPDPRDDAAALALTGSARYFNVSVGKGSAFRTDGALYLLIHRGGNLCYFGRWDEDEPFIRFDKNDLPVGVLQVLLLDGEGNPLSERLCFNGDPERMVSTMTAVPDKAHYARRDNLEVALELLDADGRPLEGDFSVAVTDDRIVDSDSPQNILTWFLLESELRGFIEDPAYYFVPGDPVAAEALDGLMLTQGWRRYDIPRAVRGVYAEPHEGLEVGQTITGRVEKYGALRKRDTPPVEVSLIVPRYNLAATVPVDADGRFVFSGFDLPHGAGCVVRAVREDGDDRGLELTLEPQETVVRLDPVPVAATENRMNLYNASVADFTDTLYNIMLDEITITAHREEVVETPYEFYADHSISYQDIDRERYSNLEELLIRVPGIRVVGKDVMYFDQPCKFIVNGSIQDELYDDPDAVPTYMRSMLQYDFNAIPISDIARVDVLRPALAIMFGMRLSHGAIAITTKSGKELLAEGGIDEFPNVKKVKPLGYQQPVEFYVPQYDTPRQRGAAERDLRTTLYWNPAVRFEDGKAVLRFTTADRPSDYTVTVEGVTAHGRIVRSTASIARQ